MKAAIPARSGLALTAILLPLAAYVLTRYQRGLQRKADNGELKQAHAEWENEGGAVVRKQVAPVAPVSTNVQSHSER